MVETGIANELAPTAITGLNDTSTVPVPAGTVAVIDVAELTVKDVAATPPNFTSVAPVSPTPVRVTVDPAAADDGDTDVICGQVPVMPLAAQARLG